MTTLFLSIATSSLIKRSLAEDSRQQPWIVRMAASLVSDGGDVQESFSCGIRAEGRSIDPGAAHVHGITSAAAQRSGCYEFFALGMVCGLKANGSRRTTDYPGMASNARYVVGWNVGFIKSVIGSLFARHGEPSGAWIRPGLSFIDLQTSASPWCRLPAPEGSEDGQYKLPTRDEAASVLLGAEPRTVPHTVDQNILLERAIYQALAERKAFEMGEVA